MSDYVVWRVTAADSFPRCACLCAAPTTLLVLADSKGPLLDLKPPLLQLIMSDAR